MEFMTAACNHQEIANQDNLRKAFSFFDKNNDGSIDINELKFALPAQDASKKNKVG